MLFELHGTPQNVIRHGEAVAEVAVDFARQLNLKAGHSFNLNEVHASGLLHDIAKGVPNHAFRGADFLRTEGFPQIADGMKTHMDLELFGSDWVLGVPELVYLADKLVVEDCKVSLEERFEKTTRFADKIEKIQNRIGVRYEVAKRIHARINQWLSVGGGPGCE